MAQDWNTEAERIGRSEAAGVQGVRDELRRRLAVVFGR
jgi:hypothetical protein